MFARLRPILLFIIMVTLMVALIIDMEIFDNNEPPVSRLTLMAFNTLGYRVGNDEFQNDWQWVQGKDAPFVVLMPKGFKHRECNLREEETPVVCFEYLLDSEQKGRFYVSAMRQERNDLYFAYQEELNRRAKENQIKFTIGYYVVERQRGLITQSVPYCRNQSDQNCPGRAKVYHTPEWMITITVRPSDSTAQEYPTIRSYYDSFFLNGIQFCKFFANPDVGGEMCNQN